MIHKEHKIAIVSLLLIGVFKPVYAGSIIYAQPDGFASQHIGSGYWQVGQFTLPQNVLLKQGSLFIFTGGQANCNPPNPNIEFGMGISDVPGDNIPATIMEAPSLPYDCGDQVEYNATSSTDTQLYASTTYYLVAKVTHASTLDLLSSSDGSTNASGWIFNNASSTNGTNYDLYKLGGLATSTGALSNEQALDVSKYCNVLSGWDATQCVLALFLVSGDQGSSLATALQSGILTKAPFGYATRLYSILATTTASTTLPDVSYTFGNASPLAGKTLTFGMGQVFSKAQDIEQNDFVSDSTSTPLNAWAILGSVVTLILWLVFAMQVFHDLTGFHLHGQKQADTLPKKA